MSKNDRYQPKLMIIRGLPGSGKSTLAKSLVDRAAKEHLEISHYENDMFLMDGDKYVWTPNKAKLAAQQCFNHVMDDLKKGKYVIVSNVFVTRSAVYKYVNGAKQFDAEILVVRKVGEHKNIHNVPEKTLKSMASAFQKYPGERIAHDSDPENKMKTPTDLVIAAYEREQDDISNANLDHVLKILQSRLDHELSSYVGQPNSNETRDAVNSTLDSILDPLQDRFVTRTTINHVLDPDNLAIASGSYDEYVARKEIATGCACDISYDEYMIRHSYDGPHNLRVDVYLKRKHDIQSCRVTTVID